MTPFDIIQALAAAGVTLRIVGNAIRYTAPRGAVTPELQAALVEVKPDILYAFNERAAIVEHDGGLDRAEAEPRAGGDVLGILPVTRAPRGPIGSSAASFFRSTVPVDIEQKDIVTYEDTHHRP